MTPSRRRLHKRRLRKRRVTFALFTVIFLAALPAVWPILRGICNSNKSGISGAESKQALSAKSEGQALRHVFKYSVVSGGVESAAELVDAANRDPIVRDHYQSINLNKVRELHLNKDMLAYVSYRVNDKIYWTQKKIQLRKGELVLTDGENLVRSRCGNRISISRVSSPGPEPAEPEFDLEEPKGPTVALIEPPAELFPVSYDVLPSPPVLVPPLPPLAVVGKSAPPEVTSSHHFLPFLLPAAVVGSTIGEISSSHSNHIVQPVGRPITVAPEPSEYVWLLAIGLGWLLLRSRRKQVRASAAARARLTD